MAFLANQDSNIRPKNFDGSAEQTFANKKKLSSTLWDVFLPVDLTKNEFESSRWSKFKTISGVFDLAGYQSKVNIQLISLLETSTVKIFAIEAFTEVI